MPRLIAELKGRGYRFVTLTEYMKLVADKPAEMIKQRAAVTRQNCKLRLAQKS
jgi:hypothetical protein